MELHSSLAEELYITNPKTLPLLPCIQCLDMHVAADGHALLFLGPTLRVDVHHEIDTPSFDRYASKIPVLSPYLSQLTLLATNLEDDATSRGSIVDILQRLTALRRISLRLWDISELGTIATTLAGLP